MGNKYAYFLPIGEKYAFCRGGGQTEKYTPLLMKIFQKIYTLSTAFTNIYLLDSVSRLTWCLTWLPFCRWRCRALRWRGAGRTPGPAPVQPLVDSQPPTLVWKNQNHIHIHNHIIPYLNDSKMTKYNFYKKKYFAKRKILTNKNISITFLFLNVSNNLKNPSPALS